MAERMNRGPRQAVSRPNARGLTALERFAQPRLTPRTGKDVARKRRVVQSEPDEVEGENPSPHRRGTSPRAPKGAASSRGPT